MWIPLVSKDFKNKIQQCFVQKGIPIHVMEKKGKTLSSIFTSSRIGSKDICTDANCSFCNQNGIDDPKVRQLCRTPDVVYEVQCKVCEEMGIANWYCGQTKRPTGDRFAEHMTAAKRCSECAENDERETTKKHKANALGSHYWESHRGVEPALRCNLVWKTFGSLDRDCMEGTTVRRVHKYNLNRRLEDNGIKFD